jgi:acetoin:2,6-dichlorophenolindophenol oxidoreductase subunit beta
MRETTYAHAILQGFEYLLENHQDVFVMGQGLWSPWYVGSTMTDLEKKFGNDRVIDTPVSELACTGAAVGASLCGYRPIIVHPRMDFMLYAIDPIVNQAAKWSHMFGGQAHPAVTVRGIINRGGEQGAQHSQSFHSWFANIPGLRVVMPSTVADARDLLIASVMCNDPVIYIDDRWLYEQSDSLAEPIELDLKQVKPNLLRTGNDFTIVGSSYSTKLCLEAADELAEKHGIECDVIDMRVINPIDHSVVIESVQKTGGLCAVDGGWGTCGLAAEIIAGVVETEAHSALKHPPIRISLPSTPAPTSKPLEDNYYPKAMDIVQAVNEKLAR